MLKKLYVENYALIDRLEMELGPGLNIITGETGAGKTILLGALGLLLGGRCDAGVIKDPQRNCIVEGVFSIEEYDLEWFFSEHDLDYDPQTIIRRVISPGGKSRCYINDLPVQVTMLKEFGTYLIDIHSQHQSLMLGEDSFRVNIVDSIAAHNSLLDDYSQIYNDLKSSERELAGVREESSRKRQDEDWLTFQVEQLGNAKLVQGEQEKLEDRQGELAHAQEIRRALENADVLLSEDENGVLSRLKTIEREVSAIGGYYPRAEELAGRVRGALVELKDIGAEAASEAERIESEPGELQRISDRLDMIYSLQQKHKVDSVAELMSLLDSYKTRLGIITGGEEIIAGLEAKIEKMIVRAAELAAGITVGRRKASDKISEYVEKMLSELGMPGSRFSVVISPAEGLRKTGADDVRFLFSSNKGTEPAPVEKIASGGEISRLMLALKSLVARSTNLPTIIFDEIDTGVSGRIADAMGSIIEELSHHMQVLNITHLPQVASKGDAHFMVYKESDGEGSRTLIRRLTRDERVAEIAKMLSGSTTTDAAITQARLLIGI